MATDYDPSVTAEILAVAMSRCVRSVELLVRTGKIPPFDTKPNRKARGWKLSTLRAWNPRVAHRIDLLLIAAA